MAYCAEDICFATYFHFIAFQLRHQHKTNNVQDKSNYFRKSEENNILSIARYQIK